MAVCTSDQLTSISSWRAGVCVKFSATQWNMRLCDSTQVISRMFNDTNCTQLASQLVFPANKCGSIGGSGGVFFSCASFEDPPVIPNTADDVFSDFIYISSGGPVCSSSSIYQSLSYKSRYCVSGENRTCECFGGACPSYLLASPCTAAPTSNPLGTCFSKTIGGILYDARSSCAQATNPTPSPSGGGPATTSPSQLAPCSSATTVAECIGGQPIAGAANSTTLPVDGLAARCCVWCGSSGGGGSCREPGFSTNPSCTCLPNTTAPATIASVYQCPSGQTATLGCSCTGRPVGAPGCTTSTGTGGGGSFSSAIAVSVALAVAVAVFGSIL